MEKDKPFYMGNRIRRCSSMSDLTRYFQHETSQQLKTTEAQVATPVESTLQRNVYRKTIAARGIKKKQPQFLLNQHSDGPLFTDNTEKILKMSNSDKKSSAVPKDTSGHFREYDCHSMQRKVVSMFDDLLKIIESKQYDKHLRQCLEKASPDYLTHIEKRKKDILKSDHGIVIAGETSAGKSTLVNKILGKRLFKGRNMESTSTICKIRNSDQVIIKTELDNGEVEVKDMSYVDVETNEGEKILRETLQNLTDLTITKGSEKYKSVDVGLPVSFLKGNTILVDTPGIGGSGTVSQKVIEYLPNAVSFIFVINVSSAGGMQRDRLPEVLKSIIDLQMDGEMPCVDPRSVIFITNKWDSIMRDPDDSSEEDEVNNTWKQVTDSINKCWPLVRNENIFKMNLTQVNIEEHSKLEFQKFRNVLEMVVKENENIRIKEHLRYLCSVLDDVCTGVRTRQELINRSREEQEKKTIEHRMKINDLKSKCKKKIRFWRKNIQLFLDKEANESFKYMSSDIGKEGILNPEGWVPIMEITYLPTTISDNVRARIHHYICDKLRSSEVVEEFKNIKDDILDFLIEISPEIEKLKNEWTGTEITDKKSSKKAATYKEGSVAPYVAGVIATSPVWFPLLAAGVAIAVASVPFAAPVMAYLSRDSRRKKLIDKEYEKCKLEFRSQIYNSMKSNYGEAFKKLISKVTDDILQRRIQFVEETINELSRNREEIIANQKSLMILAERIKSMKDVAEEALSSCSTEYK